MCRGWLPLCHGSRLVRALRAIEAVGQTSAIPPALALPCPVAALPYVLALAPTANPLRHLKIFFQKRLPSKRLPLNGLKSNFAAFSGKGHEAIFEFHASPYRGVHHGGVSLWPCSSRRQVTRHGRQPGVRTHPWEVLVRSEGPS